MDGPTNPRDVRCAIGMILLGALLGLVVGVVGLPSARADSGRGTVYKVTALGGSPASYRLVVSSVDDVAVGDHLIAYTATSSGVWEVTATDTSAETVDVQELLTEEQGAAFGAPVATGPRNVYGFSTPGANGLTRIPDSSVAYAAAALRRNALLVVGTADVTTAVAGCVAVFNGDAWMILVPGTDGQVLTADSTAPGGVSWQ